MPFHNATNTSEEYIRNIINAVSGRGNLAFILTCQPDTIYTDVDDISWIYNAIDDTNPSNYVRAFYKAFQYGKQTPLQGACTLCKSRDLVPRTYSRPVKIQSD